MKESFVLTRDKAFGEFIDGLNRLYNPDKILREKGIDISIYRTLTYDSHVDSCITSRESGLLASEFDVELGENSRIGRKIADFVKDILINGDIDLFEVIRYAQESIYFGYGVYEWTLKKDGGNIVFDKIVGLPQEWFAFNKENELLFLSKKNYTGEKVNQEDILLLQYRASYKNPYGEGKFARIFYPVSIKKAIFKFGVSFAEKFGSVILYIATKTQDSNKTRQLLDMLYNMVQDSVGVIETTDELKTLPVDKSGSSELYTNFINLCNAEISKAILGQTLTTESSNVGSYSLGKVHFDVRKDIIEHDKKWTAKAINKLIRKLVDLNYSDVVYYPSLKYYEEDITNKEFADRDMILKTLGVKFTKEYFIDRYKLQENQFELEDTLETGFSEDKKKINFLDKTVFIEFADSVDREDKTIESLFERTKETFQNIFKPLFLNIQKAIETANDYDDAIEKLLKNTFNVLDNNAIDEVSKYFVNADLIGRHFIKERSKKFAEETDDVDFLRLKIAMTKDKYLQIAKEYRNYCFTVSNVKSKEIVEDILETLIETRGNGEGYKEFVKKMSDKRYAVDEIVYWQNIRACQNAGKYRQMIEDKDIAPYWQYIAIKDNRTRPDHLALNGIIRRYDDEFWNTYYPPNGFRCRCTVRSLSKEYLKSKLGLDDKDIGRGTAGITVIVDDGFKNNVGKDLYKWVEVKNKISPSDWEGVINKKINIKNELKDIEAKEIKLYEYSGKDIKIQVEEAEKIINSFFDKENIIFDKFNNPVYIDDVKKLIRHIIEEQPDRIKYITLIKDVLKNPDMIIQNVYIKPKGTKGKGEWEKKGMTKIANEYIIKIKEDGEEKYITFALNYAQKYKKDVLWTLYKTSSRQGIRIF